MKREDGMEPGRLGGAQERLGLRRLTKREIDRRIAAIAAEVAMAFEGADTERVEYLGQAIYPRPMDTKKFIRLMAKHMSLN